MDVMKAGGLIVAGTDTPNGFNLHGELEAYILAGMTPYQALRAATVNSAKALGLDAGSIEAGKLADLVIVEGNPLENIANAHHVKRVIANGRLFDMNDLLNDTYESKAGGKLTAGAGRVAGVRHQDRSSRVAGSASGCKRSAPVLSRDQRERL